MKRWMRWTWALAALLAAAPLGAQQFGAAAAVGQDVLLISEPVQDAGPATVHVFRRSGNGWVADGALQRPDAAPERDYFGRALAIDGNTLFVGGTTVEESTGTIWQFQRTGSGWNFVGQLRPPEVVPGDSYGRVALVSDGMLFVTSLGHAETGAVWAFRREASGQWVQEAKLTPAGAGAQHFFGWSLAYEPEGDRLLVGAITPPTQNRGAAYIFHREAPGQWTQEAAFPAEETRPPAIRWVSRSRGWATWRSWAPPGPTTSRARCAPSRATR